MQVKHSQRRMRSESSRFCSPCFLVSGSAALETPLVARWYLKGGVPG
jgi:hypothetical protein